MAGETTKTNPLEKMDYDEIRELPEVTIIIDSFHKDYLQFNHCLSQLGGGLKRVSGSGVSRCYDTMKRIAKKYPFIKSLSEIVESYKDVVVPS